jgi:hypothetical protein
LGRTPTVRSLFSRTVGLAAGALFAQTPAAIETSKRFDGEWNTILSCPNFAGALGYSSEFATLIKEGVLHREKGVKGEAGWLQLDGAVSPMHPERDAGLKDGHAL